MLYITLVTVGQVKMPHVRDGIHMYRERLSAFSKLEEIVMQAGDPVDENARILKRLSKSDDVVIVLDERGKHMTSEKFSAYLSDHEKTGRHVTVVIGGAYGLTDDVRKEADLILSLSAMTLPHELAQLVFFEQLYRGLSIAHGGKYHHG